MHPIVHVDLFLFLFVIDFWLKSSLTEKTYCVVLPLPITPRAPSVPSNLAPVPRREISGNLLEVLGKLSELSGNVRKPVGNFRKVVAHAQCGPRDFPESCRTGSHVITSYPRSLIDVPCRGLLTKAITIDGFRDSTNITSSGLYTVSGTLYYGLTWSPGNSL